MDIDAHFDTVAATNAHDVQIAEETALASGKEPFELARLEAMMGVDLSDRAASLRAGYFIRHPEVRTLREFADLLCQLEPWG